MNHKRIHIRVPVLGNATLSNTEGFSIQAQTIDICAGGLRIANPSAPLTNCEYTIEVTSFGRGTITFTALLVHASEHIAGFKIVEMGQKDLETIYHLVADFQSTEDFIKHIDEGTIIHDWFIDDNGDKLDVTFEVAA